ncbi:hypothetical protein PpBr36_08820 [Pyricularia pennisetigena]|uniref:hypothetical protein n=1 Tax=Pyricularia pennisetigena TaxID=1578925 RepID=UPI00114DFFE4|nr:hypothetical protein PpBr36_08820 [Pyricularia pennisetigena]TLS24125.1 hypothetical protein PpBr36_08820 [Pyricularia pennisetigena]
MSDKDVAREGVVAHENVSGKPRKRGCIGHCGRFWWAYLIALVIIIVIVVPVVILVAVPRIAQDKIDAAELEVRDIKALDTQTQNFTMEIDSGIRTDGKVHAQVAPFEGVMYLEDWAPQRPFAKIRFPETSSAAFQDVKVSQFVNVEDMEAFTVFNTWLLVNDTLRVTIRGDTTVRVRGIARDYPVVFKKTTTMPGLNLFRGTTVSDPKILSGNSTGDHGANFQGTVTIPNQSRVTFEVGNATFFNYLGDRDVGEVYINNMTIRPGNNVFPMTAKVNNEAVLSAMTKRPACETGKVTFGLRGKKVENHGQPLPYFADSLASANQTVEIDISQALGFKIPCSQT